MLKSLRTRLIVSYVAVVLPALALATLVYLTRSAEVKTEDAYTQLRTSLYLVAPQVENVLVRDRIAAAVDAIRALLPPLEDPATAQAAARPTVLQATARIRAGLQQVDDLLKRGVTPANRARIAAAAAAMRPDLTTIDKALPAASATAAVAAIRDALSDIEDPTGHALAPADRQRLGAATQQIQNELAATKFRLLLIRRDGYVVVDSQAGAANMAGKGTVTNLPAGLALATKLAQPLPGTLRADAAGKPWIYEAAAGRILLNQATGAATPARPPGYYLLLAQRPPDLGDIWRTFVSQFLFFGVAAVLASLAFGLVLARSITRPIATLARATHAIAQGDFDHHAPVTGPAEMQALAVDFNRMAAEVQRTHQAQQDFLANVSHDLKTPLTSIGGFSGAMLDGTIRDPQAYRDAAAIINAEAGRMARLVADVVDLARLQSGASALQPQPTDLVALLQQAVAGLRPQAAEHGVELRIEAGTAPPVIVDADRLRRAITNLLDNAVRHTPPAGQVAVGVQPVGETVRIYVRDTGPGIPPQDLPRIFERFYQVDKSRAPHGQGSGLGLAIVREVVAAHGGTVTAQNSPGAGALFTISLPRAGFVAKSNTVVV